MVHNTSSHAGLSSSDERHGIEANLLIYETAKIYTLTQCDYDKKTVMANEMLGQSGRVVCQITFPLIFGSFLRPQLVCQWPSVAASRWQSGQGTSLIPIQPVQEVTQYRDKRWCKNITPGEV